ncbi:hypothetical protein SY2F82_39130 [Streptomyces sp. Y2F8-2]|nr:hypothetical protein SY2F82_39130 [Streptomyces sp. Y2F8-2]
MSVSRDAAADPGDGDRFAGQGPKRRSLGSRAGSAFPSRHAIDPSHRRSYHPVEALAWNRFAPRLPGMRETRNV